MRAPGLVGPTPHIATFSSQACSPGTDPFGFSSNQNPLVTSYSEFFRTPYLSPPMSGSPSPDSRLHLSKGTRRRRQSSSPTSPTSPTSCTPRHAAEAITASAGYTIRSISDVLNHDVGPLSHIPAGASIASDGLPPQQPLGTPLSISRPATLPARPARRNKTHVASACVNCKQKHLGCDSARPCRRCVIAGKEASCRDVTHKRRGRPPLKAEEGPLRSYDSSYTQPVAPRITPQSHVPVPGQRPSTTRVIRPMPGLPPISAASEPGNPYASFWPNTTHPAHPTLQLAPVLSPPYPPAANSMHWQPYMPVRGGQFAPRPDLGPPPPIRRMSDSSTGARRYPTEQYPYHRPSQYQGQQIHHQSPPYANSMQTTQRPSTTGGLYAQPVKLPSISEIRLAPIRPSSLSSAERRTQLSPAMQNFAPPAWPRPAQRPRTESAGDYSNVDTYRTQPNAQFNNPFSPGTGNRTSNPQLPGPSLLSSPSTNNYSSPTRPFASSPSQPPQHVQASTREEDKETQTNTRPLKRQKMELGEMVNE